jgi:hypothetical protein
MPHDWNPWKPGVGAAGSEVSLCARCGATRTRDASGEADTFVGPCCDDAGLRLRCEAAEAEGAAARRRKLARRREARRAREDVLRSLGLRKVRGNLSGTYWE